HVHQQHHRPPPQGKAQLFLPLPAHGPPPFSPVLLLYVRGNGDKYAGTFPEKEKAHPRKYLCTGKRSLCVLWPKRKKATTSGDKPGNAKNFEKIVKKVLTKRLRGGMIVKRSRERAKN